MALFDWVSHRIFNSVHRNNLVYNTCWEDPRLDRVALDFQPDDNVLVITSAGCNALDYVLCEPRHVYAVDMNPRQNALLELKQAGIRQMSFDDFFQLFGQGRLRGVKAVYRTLLRPQLSPWSQSFWDKKIHWFDHPRRSFYFRGSSGWVARMFDIYTDRVIRVRPYLEQLLAAETIEEQRKIYDEQVYKKFWSGLVKFAVGRDTTLSLLGVPRAQRRQIELHYRGGVVQYVQDCMRAVFAELPLKDNYFWRVYINGEYSRGCCPEYLTAAGFERLKAGLVDRVSTHTDSLQGFLEKHDEPISKFVLLDHMDWLSDRFFPMLEAEWQAILRRAASRSRLIWRSGGLRTDFLNQVRVMTNGQTTALPELLTFHNELAEKLHARDRVHTYASFYIAELRA